MRIAAVTISIVLLAYVLICATILPFTIDEAWTYEEFVKGEFWNIVTYAHPVPNNHILNSLLVKPFAAVSTSELSLRFLNVLAFVLYLYAAWRISQMFFESRVLKLSLFSALLLNNMLIHFFALCRGYGLSIGLMLFSIYLLLLLFKRYSNATAHACLFIATLSVYASFVLMHAFLAISVLVFFAGFRVSTRNIRSFWIAARIPLLYTTLVVILCAYPIKQAIRWELLGYGGTTNFVDDTLFSLLLDLIGERAQEYRGGLNTAILSILAFIFIAAVYRFFARHEKHFYYFIAPFTLFFCILAINLQFYLLDSPLVIRRTALYLYPLLILSIFSAIAMFRQRLPFAAKSFALALCGSLLYFFIIQPHFIISGEWWFEAYNKKVLTHIEKRTTPGKKIKILVYNLSSNSFNYYIGRKYTNIIEPVENIGDINSVNLINYDYIYMPSWVRFNIPSVFDRVQSYGDNNFVLFAKRS